MPRRLGQCRQRRTAQATRSRVEEPGKALLRDGCNAGKERVEVVVGHWWWRTEKFELRVVVQLATLVVRREGQNVVRAEGVVDSLHHESMGSFHFEQLVHHGRWLTVKTGDGDFIGRADRLALTAEAARMSDASVPLVDTPEVDTSVECLAHREGRSNAEHLLSHADETRTLSPQLPEPGGRYINMTRVDVATVPGTVEPQLQCGTILVNGLGNLRVLRSRTREDDGWNCADGAAISDQDATNREKWRAYEPSALAADLELARELHEIAGARELSGGLATWDACSGRWCVLPKLAKIVR